MENHDTSTHPSTPWTSGAVVAAVAVGMGMLVLWRLCRRGCRQLELRTAVDGRPAELYRFLCDPDNLKIVHPCTTEIRMKKETEEEDGATTKEFDWVEKVPFTVVSAVRMRCDPTTSTISIDVVPVGGIHQVELKWQLTSNNSLSSDQETHPQESKSSTDSKITQKDPADDNQITTSGSEFADDETGTERSWATDKESTEFRNHIKVTGPSGLLYVLIKLIGSMEKKLMDRLQDHFKNRSK